MRRPDQRTASFAPTPDGVDVVLTRRIRGSLEDVWASLTEPDRTARWYGRWEGTGAPGETVQVQLGFEEGQPTSQLRIDACDPPRRLAVTAVDGDGRWPIEIALRSDDDDPGLTVLTFVQHPVTGISPADIATGWEFYLDQLEASRSGDPMPRWADYAELMADYAARADDQ